MFDLMNWLDDAPIHLTSGVGDPETGGCWMSAISIYSGAAWGDHPPCVCPIIASLCIALNDIISTDAARGEIIGPHLLAPVGSASSDPAILERRRWHIVDAAVRRFAPHALRSAGLIAEAEKLEALPPVTSKNHKAAAAAADAAWRAAAWRAAAWRAADADAAAAAAADAAWRAAAWRAADADAAAAAAAAAAWRAAAARDAFARDVVLPVVLELCAIGDTTPVERACCDTDLRRVLQVV